MARPEELMTPIEEMPEYGHLNSLVPSGGRQILAQGPIPAVVPNTRSGIVGDITLMSPGSPVPGPMQVASDPMSSINPQTADIAAQLLKQQIEKKQADLMGQQAGLQTDYESALKEAAIPMTVAPSIETAIARALAAGLGTGVGALIGGWQGAGGAARTGLSSYQEWGEQDKELAKGKQAQKMADASLIKGKLEDTKKRLAKFEDNLFTLGKDVSIQDMQHQNRLSELQKKADLGLGKGTTVNVGPGQPEVDKAIAEAQTTFSNVARIEELKEKVKQIQKEGVFEFQFKGAFSATPEGKLRLEIMKLAAELLKADQGSRPSDFDMKIYQRMLNGDYTASPEDIWKLLDGTQDTIRMKAQSRLDQMAPLVSLDKAGQVNYMKEHGYENAVTNWQKQRNKYGNPLYSTIQAPSNTVWKYVVKDDTGKEVIETLGVSTTQKFSRAALRAAGVAEEAIANMEKQQLVVD